MDLENLSHRGRSADVLHGLPVKGRPADLPGGSILRTSGKKDGDAGTFYVPACPRHCGYFEGWKPSPPTVSPMRHAGPLTYTERKSPCFLTVCDGGGGEEALVNGGSNDGEHVEVL